MSSQHVGRSRVGRGVRFATGAAGLAARQTAARAMTAGHDGEAGRRAATKQQLKAAEGLVKLFSGMRGAAMKVGQTLSAVDIGMVPEEVRPEFQEVLAQLQQDAEPVSFRAITKVVEQDLGARLSASFADIDPEPLAAASIGQVHRATLHDGRDVVVKVQYPGIAEAIHADMQNLRLGLKLLAILAPGIDTRAIADEIRERIGDELDYELEAANQSEMARIYRDHPFVVVPDVVTSLAGERVLVTEYVEGRRFAELHGDTPRADRDRWGEILVRFYLNGPLRHRLLNGDPHPGNSLFLPDGRIGFIDFGFSKHLGDVDVRQIIASTRATYQGDAQALLAVASELHALAPDPALAEPFLESYASLFGWALVDEPVMADATRTADMMRTYTELRSSKGFEGLELPAEHFVIFRAVFLLLGLVGQLHSTNRWLDITREWLLGDGPATELGREEEAFFAGRYAYPAV
ncbi:MAG: ABC1 kinase family protein [Solirubrobacteraceae bacterium]